MRSFVFLAFGLALSSLASAQPQAKIVASKAPAAAVDAGVASHAADKAPQANSEAEPTGEEIGYDPKVKRDPYGNVISETAPAAPLTESQKLRRDENLRSDRSLIVPTAPIPGPSASPTPPLKSKTKAHKSEKGLEAVHR